MSEIPESCKRFPGAGRFDPCIEPLQTNERVAVIPEELFSDGLRDPVYDGRLPLKIPPREPNVD